LTVKEKTLLKQYATKIPKDGIIIEVGSYLGASACFLAVGAKKPDQRIYCIDTWHNEGMTEGVRDTFSEFKKNTEKFNNIIPLRGKSEDIAKNFKQKIDLLFIDGDHSYETVKIDLNAWLPHTKNGAILIMHDYGWAEGVIKSVDEIVKPIEIKRGKSIENMYITHINNELFK
jgi:predicted O-methyltransferase YrrM